MASKIKVDLELSTNGYVASIKEAEKSTSDYSKTVEMTSKDIKLINRETKDLTKEAKALAKSYAKLTEEQKNSTAGRAMQAQIQDAIKEAAKLLDIDNDISEQIRVMASDTAAWDAMKQGIDIVKSAGMTAVSVLGEMGVETENLQKLVSRLALVENGFNTVINIGNALQKQSALMNGLRKAGIIDVTKVTVAETAATTANATATEVATKAQIKFNAACLANPYVIMGAAVIASAAAFIYFASNAEKAETQLEKLNNEMNEVRSTAAQSAAAEITKIDILFKKIQDENTSRQEKLKIAQYLKNEYPTILSNLSAEEIATNKTADAYDRLASSIMAAATARAAEEKAAEAKKKEYEARQKENDALQKKSQLLEKIDKEQRQQQAYVPGAVGPSSGVTSTQSNNEDDYRLKAVNKEITEARKGISDAKKEQKFFTDEVIKARQEANGLADEYNKIGNTGGGSKPTVPIKDSLEDLEKQLSDLQSNRKKGLLPQLDTKEYLKQVDDLEKQIRAKKIELGMEVPDVLSEIDRKLKELDKNQLDVNLRLNAEDYKAEKKRLENEKFEIKVKWGFENPKSTIDQIKDKIKELETLRLTPGLDNDALEGIKQDIKALNQELSNEEIRLKIKADPVKEGKTEAQKFIRQNTKEYEAPEFDFSALKENAKNPFEEMVANMADLVGQQLDAVTSKMSELQDIIDFSENADEIANAKAQLEELIPVYEQLREAAAGYQEAANNVKAAANNTKNLQKNLQGVGNALNATNSAFGALAEATGKKEFNIAGTIAQAIASIALGYAQASSSPAATNNPWVWIAFAIAGLATTISTIAAIKNATAGSYATGGVIPGTSVAGDKLYARVNSREMIFTTQQQKRLLDIANGQYINRTSQTNQNQSVVIESIGVRGEDIVLAAANYLKTEGRTSIL